MTSKEFSKIVGVSQSTVSRALNGAEGVSEEKRKMIIDMAHKCNFELNASAKALKTQKTNRIGILFSKDFIGFDKNVSVAAIYEKLRNEILSYGYDTYPIYGKGEKRLLTAKNAILRNDVDAMVILYTNERPESELLRILDEKNVANVGIFSEKHEIAGIGKNIVMDYSKGIYIGFEYLFSQGHRKIAFCSPKYDYSSQLKYSGLMKAYKDLGLVYDKSEQIFADGYTFGDGYECACENLDMIRRCTAVFGHNDAVALGIIAALSDNGIKVPEDMSVIGLDNIIQSKWWKPHLTTSGFDIERLVRKTTEMLMKLINGEETEDCTVFDPHIIVRDSVSKPRENI